MNDEYGNAKKAFDEDWLVNSTNFQTVEQPQNAFEISPPPPQVGFDSDDEIVTIVRGGGGGAAVTTENEKQDGWKMPEPVFRVSEGKTPDKSDKSNKAAQNDLPFSEAIILEKISNPALIQAQPNISQQFTVSDTIEKSSAKTESKNFNIIFVVLGFAAIVVFAIAFLAVVIFLFFYKTEM